MQSMTPRMKFGMLLGVLVVLGLGWLLIGSKGPASAAEIREQAKRLSEAVAKGDYGKVADLTYPKVVEEAGGRAKMIETMKAVVESMAEQGLKVLPGTIGEPTEPLTEGPNMFVVVPMVSEFATSKGKMVGKSYLLGISSDKGHTWSFVQGGSFDDPSVRAKLLPKLPPALKLPADEEPHLIPEGNKGVRSRTQGHRRHVFVRQ